MHLAGWSEGDWYPDFPGETPPTGALNYATILQMPVRTEADNVNYANWEAANPAGKKLFDQWQGVVIPKRAATWVYDFSNATPGPPPFLNSISPLPAFAGWSWGDVKVFPGAKPFFDKAGIGDWQTFLANAGMNPYAEYISILHQHHINGATSYDQMFSLYRKTWNGYGHMISFPFNDGSAWKWAAPVLRSAVAVVAMMGGQAWLSAEIGAAVMGSYATTYPALTQAIGQVAISTAASGGDVETAVKQAAYSYVGGAGGALVTSVSDSATIGALAASATRAALAGQDVTSAVVTTLLASGARSIDQVLSAPAETKGPNTMFEQTTDFNPEGFDFSSTGPGLGFGDSLVGPPAGGGFFDGGYDVTADDYPTGFGQPDMTGIDPNIGAQIPVYTAIPDVPGYGSTGTGSGGFVAELTALALAAIKVNAAYRASESAIRTVQTTPDGRVSSPNANGTLTTRDASGRVIGTTKPSTGVPFVLPDGRTIINNGNGTYDLIGVSGGRQTLQYPSTVASAAGDNSQLMLWGGAALLAFMVLK